MGGQGKRTSSVFRQLWQCAVMGALAFLSYFIISHYFFQSVRVVGRSMTPTLRDSQQYLLNRWIYYVRAPQRLDVVVIRDPADNGFSVKRIIGVSGDSIYLKNGAVYVNGRKLNEPYLPALTPTYPFGSVQEQLIICGKEQYFLLGDNRMNSADSRSYGPVSRNRILGLIVR
jgi:signal peptidase I